MMSDSKNQLSEEQINDLVEALPHALHPVDRHIKVALVRNGYRALKNFPSSVESPRWNDLKDDCAFTNAQRNEVIDALFPHQPQPQGGQSQASSLEERLEAIVTKVVGPIKKALDLVIAEMLDPWERIHSETESVVGANEKSNLDPVSNYYGTKKSYYCMVLGKVTHCQIICAHIWPRLTLDKGLEAFELTCMDVNSPRNFLRLHQSIEKAFDKKRLIFVPAESMIEGETALKVVILDPTLLEEDLDYSGHTIKFSAINGRVFDYKFTCDKSPFTRLISNHALQAMNKAKTLNWIAQDDSEMVAVRTSAIELARKSLGQESYSMQAFFK